MVHSPTMIRCTLLSFRTLNLGNSSTSRRTLLPRVSVSLVSGTCTTRPSRRITLTSTLTGTSCPCQTVHVISTRFRELRSFFCTNHYSLSSQLTVSSGHPSCLLTPDSFYTLLIFQVNPGLNHPGPSIRYLKPKIGQSSSVGTSLKLDPTLLSL